jgi:hypothetical protein
MTSATASLHTPHNPCHQLWNDQMCVRSRKCRSARYPCVSLNIETCSLHRAAMFKDVESLLQRSHIMHIFDKSAVSRRMLYSRSSSLSCGAGG